VVVSLRASVGVGIVGGIVDLASGFTLLAGPNSGAPPMGMMPSPGVWGGLLLLAMGVVVLVTTLLMLGDWGMRFPAIFRVLMVVYGIAMLIIGVAMVAQVFPMTSGFLLSGGMMVIVGAAMLVSAASRKIAMGRIVS
jgi:hypothetical protein